MTSTAAAEMMQVAPSLCQLLVYALRVHRAQQHHGMRTRHATEYKDEAECLGKTIADNL